MQLKALDVYISKRCTYIKGVSQYLFYNEKKDVDSQIELQLQYERKIMYISSVGQ